MKTEEREAGKGLNSKRTGRAEWMVWRPGIGRKEQTCTSKEWMKSAAWHRYKIRLGEWILRLSGQEG